MIGAALIGIFIFNELKARGQADLLISLSYVVLLTGIALTARRLISPAAFVAAFVGAQHVAERRARAAELAETPPWVWRIATDGKDVPAVAGEILGRLGWT